MRYRDASTFRQALEQRLKNVTDNEPGRLARVRKRVAFERLLARLVVAAPGRWLLKGGFALDMRLPDRARSTKDVDIQWHAAANDLPDLLLDATSIHAGDFFTFAIEDAGVPEDRLGGSRRFRVSTTLAGRPFETFALDVGLRTDDPIRGERLTTDGLLAFADVPPIEVDAIPLELHVAEKLHAYTRTYEGNRPSTRVKDLIDLALIAELSGLDAAVLTEAIAETFAQRRSHPVPTELPAPPEAWAAPYRRLAEAVALPGSIAHGHAAAAALLDPVLARDLFRPPPPPAPRSA
jgi:hypothetical protein